MKRKTSVKKAGIKLSSRTKTKKVIEPTAQEHQEAMESKFACCGGECHCMQSYSNELL